MQQTRLLPPRYEDAQPIARGGMGEVYRAHDTALDRDVAVKVLSDWYAGNAEVRERFTREALAAARLSGEPNTVTIFDVGEWDGTPFIVMEYVTGGSLEDRAREGAADVSTVVVWLDQAARALDAAHRNGVVHRDVKPANLLLDREGAVHVADFGIASATGLAALTRTGTVLGTAGYLSPEQAAGERATPASDRYALGVVAFELLTGERPFAAESAAAEALGHAQGTVPSASARNPRLPPEVDAVLGRALAKDPEARYPSCSELVRDLRAALAGGEATTRILPGRPAESRRPALPLVVAGGLALLLVGLAAALSYNGGETGQLTTSALVTTVVTTAPPVTVTAEPPPPPPPAEPTPAELNDQAFALLQEGRYEEALALAEQAYAGLQGTGELVEAYAAYNYAWALAGVGRCADALPLLDRSAAIQGKRKEIKELRKDCEKAIED